MDQLFTIENVIGAATNPELKKELIETTRMIMIGLYLQATTHSSDETEQGEADDIEAVQCERCGELTMYSGNILLPGSNIPAMCLSEKCIETAVSTLAQ
jgi:formylmethanofuran dehydrogenase subunit E